MGEYVFRFVCAYRCLSVCVWIARKENAPKNKAFKLLLFYAKGGCFCQGFFNKSLKIKDPIIYAGKSKGGRGYSGDYHIQTKMRVSKFFEIYYKWGKFWTFHAQMWVLSATLTPPPF